MEREVLRNQTYGELFELLLSGHIITIPMWEYRKMESIKLYLMPLLGPLQVGVDIERERYRMRYDRNKLWKKNPDLWY